jgi:hypothetical protein
VTDRLGGLMGIRGVAETALSFNPHVAWFCIKEAWKEPELGLGAREPAAASSDVAKNILPASTLRALAILDALTSRRQSI